MALSLRFKCRLPHFTVFSFSAHVICLPAVKGTRVCGLLYPETETRLKIPRLQVSYNVACVAGRIVCTKFKWQSHEGNSQEGSGEKQFIVAAHRGSTAKTLPSHTILAAAQATRQQQNQTYGAKCQHLEATCSRQNWLLWVYIVSPFRWTCTVKAILQRSQYQSTNSPYWSPFIS